MLQAFASQRKVAVERYSEFVLGGIGNESPWDNLQNQIYLGSDSFVDDVQCKIQEDQPLKDIPREQLIQVPKPLTYYIKYYRGRDLAMAKAYLSGGYTLSEVGEYFGVSRSTVSRVMKKYM